MCTYTVRCTAHANLTLHTQPLNVEKCCSRSCSRSCSCSCSRSLSCNCSRKGSGDDDDVLFLQEKILLDSMFDVPGSDIVDVIITDETIRGNKPAEYVRRPADMASDSDYESAYEEEEMSVRNS